MTSSDQQPRQPGEPQEVSPAELFRQLTDGSGRWVFTVLALVGVAAVILAWKDPELYLYVPFVSDATGALWVVTVVTVFWCLLAVVNWRARR